MASAHASGFLVRNHPDSHSLGVRLVADRILFD
jgi:hypothetical protein